MGFIDELGDDVTGWKKGSVRVLAGTAGMTTLAHPAGVETSAIAGI